MQCPSCKSACPDDVRFCLHCGQYFGELDETTWVQPPRTPAPTTVRADATIFPSDELPKSDSAPYQPPRPRNWPVIVPLSLLAAVVLMIVGGLIASALLQKGDRAASDSPGNNRISALTTPPPRPITSPPAEIMVPSPTQSEKLAMQTERQQAATPAATATVNIQTAEPTSAQSSSFTIVNQRFVVPAGRFVPFRFTIARTSHVTGQFQAYGGKNDIAVAIMSEAEFPAFSNGGYYHAYYNTGYITSDTPALTLPPGTYYLTFDDRAAVIIGKTVVARFVVSP